jgi:hypothetical protein
MANRFNSKQSEKYKQAVTAMANLAASEGVDAANRAYAEATTEFTKENYAKSHHVKQANENYHVCPTRLTKLRCTSTLRNPCFEKVPSGDHVTEWKQGRQTKIITSEPYGLAFHQLRELVSFCDSSGLQADISADSWHFPGRTLLVEMRKARETEVENSGSKQIVATK